MNTLATAILAGLTILAAGCSITPPQSTPPNRVCNFTQYPINVPLPSLAQGESATETRKPDARLTTQLTQALLGPDTSMLFLSGGSQNGAFGAGFLQGWAASNGDELPAFNVVTGISTGAILATWAFVSEPDAPVDAYRIERESQLLRPFVRRGGGGDVSLLGYVNAVRRGGFADLAPLRARLIDRLDDDVGRPRAGSSADGRRRTIIEEVAYLASEAGGNRVLLVGVVNLDDGQAYALDLGDMAERYVRARAANDTAAQEVAINCYADAIVASSSVPLAALPVFIDNQMLIDGGARFGMFSEDLLSGVPERKKHTTDRTQLYVIANGDLETSSACGEGSRPRRVRRNGRVFEEQRLCTTWRRGQRDSERHDDWDLLQLAARSEQILVNQVYRFSADRILSRKNRNPVSFARIGALAQQHRAEITNPELVSRPTTRTCSEWWNQDEDELRPLQFYPRYMHCLIDYGRARGLEGRWDSVYNPAAPPEPAVGVDGKPQPGAKPQPEAGPATETTVGTGGKPTN